MNSLQLLLTTFTVLTLYGCALNNEEILKRERDTIEAERQPDRFNGGITLDERSVIIPKNYVKLGLSPNDIQGILGDPTSIKSLGPSLYYYYVQQDGRTFFVLFKENKAVEIGYW